METIYKNIAGAILAGGHNSRMQGRNKAFIRIDGTPLIERIVSLFKCLFGEIIIVTNAPEDYADFSEDCCLVSDSIKDIGPLGGIHAGLTATAKKAGFFVACDMPNLHNEIIIKQIDHFKAINSEALVPRVGTRIEPLHAVYTKKCKDAISMFTKRRGDTSIRSFLETVDAGYWDLEESCFYREMFRNLNTPEEVKEVKGTEWKSE